MSERRKPGDWVRLLPSAGTPGSSMRGKSHILLARITDQGSEPCTAHGCGDPQCREWDAIQTEPDPQFGGERYIIYEVSECQMLSSKISAQDAEKLAPVLAEIADAARRSRPILEALKSAITKGGR